MTYTLPFIPPSNNRFIGRKNVHEYQRIKKQWAELIALRCRPRPEKPLRNVTVRIIYYFPDHIRRDPDNYSGKMLLDGLVRSGIIEDDSFSCIRLELIGDYDKQNPRTVIQIDKKGD